MSCFHQIYVHFHVPGMLPFPINQKVMNVQHFFWGILDRNSRFHLQFLFRRCIEFLAPFLKPMKSYKTLHFLTHFPCWCIVWPKHSQQKAVYNVKVFCPTFEKTLVYVTLPIKPRKLCGNSLGWGLHDTSPCTRGSVWIFSPIVN